MKAFGVALLVLGYSLFYAGLSNISTGGQGYGFLQSLGFKGNAGIGINTQNFVSSIVPGGSSVSGSSATGGTGSVQPATVNRSPVAGTQQTSGGGSVQSV